MAPTLWPQLLHLKHPSGAMERVGFKRGGGTLEQATLAGLGKGPAGALGLMRERRGQASAVEAEGHSVNQDLGKLVGTALNPRPVCRAGLLGCRGRQAAFLLSENPQSEDNSLWMKRTRSRGGRPAAWEPDGQGGLPGWKDPYLASDP